SVAEHFEHVITIEDGTVVGGMGSAVLEFMADNKYPLRVTRLGVRDSFVEHGATSTLYHMLRLDVEGIADVIRQIVSANG
ncbi:MAG: 1-deoxy-D-xylulose-5-phosphate synthase, partial [Paludibacteraceae bacterium]|nr:1-deoxy-D-xylulose-5-phosphate synthase [Paludibacteraceae bacterium]